MRKKQYLLFAAVLVLLMTGCKKENENGVPKTFTAIISQSPSHGAKVHLDEVSAGLRPGWDADDKINVNGAECTVGDIEADNASQARFSGTISNNPDGPYYSIYPYEGSTITMTGSGSEATASATVFMPRVQIYNSNDDGKQLIDAPMAAYNPIHPTLQFRNLCGLMEIKVTNDKVWDMIIDSVQIEANNFQLSGEMNVEVSDFAYSESENGYNGYNPHIAAANTGKSIVSLARAKTNSSDDEFNSLNIFVKSNKWSISGADHETSCKLYVYIPTIAQGSTNTFTVRVFTHPVWDKETNSSTFGDPEVHIVYTKQQSGTTNGYIGPSELLKVSINVDQDCFPFGTTITSMKAFSTVRNQTNPYKVCFSRGNLQYYATGNSNQNGGNDNNYRFSPRQWSFVNKSSMGNSDYSGWIDHFVWSTGNNPEYRVAVSLSHFNNGDNLYDGTSGYVGDPRSTDWGSHLRRGIWRTPSRSELYNLLPWGSPFDNSDQILEDTSSRFVWVALSGVLDVNGQAISSNLTTPLYGVMLIPDAWRNNGSPFSSILSEPGANRLLSANLNKSLSTNNSRKLYNDNSLSIQQLEYYEAKGCIFLPCTGSYDLDGTLNDGWNKDIAVTNGPEGTYWSSTYHHLVFVLLVNIHTSYNLKLKVGGGTLNTYVYAEGDMNIGHKASVRLVCPYGTPYKFDPDQM